MPPIASAIGWPLERLRGVAGRLARENAERNPSRTAVTAAALMIGLALVTFVTVLAAGLRASINDTVDKNFAGDLVLTNKDGVLADSRRGRAGRSRAFRASPRSPRSTPAPGRSRASPARRPSRASTRGRSRRSGSPRSRRGPTTSSTPSGPATRSWSTTGRRATTSAIGDTALDQDPDRQDDRADGAGDGRQQGRLLQPRDDDGRHGAGATSASPTTRST